MNRLLRNTLQSTLPIGSALLMSGCTAQTIEKQPNIVLFMVDDMGWQDTSVPFYNDSVTNLNKRFHTPNMERLAQMGTRFTQAYACAVSSPTRCSLMTGMNAARHRVTNWTLKYETNNDYPNDSIQTPEWNWNGIQPDTVTSPHNTLRSTPATTLPQLLQQAGYHTIHCGKAHFGAISTPGENPLNMGFDVNIGGAANGAPGSYLGTANFGSGVWQVKGLESYHGKDIFLSEALTLEAKKAISTAIDSIKKPFYLYMSHYAVHIPFSRDRRFFDNYLGKYDEALGDTLREQEARYCSIIEGMDKSLGDLIDFLEERGELENTIIIFMSDNGGLANSPRQGKRFTQNAPANAGKGSSYEGGVHEPMIVYMPGVTKAGDINEHRLIIEDFFPTILDMANVKDYKTVQTIDGVSFLPQIKEPQLAQKRTLYWHYPNIWGEIQDRSYGYGAYSSILKGDYKMIYFWQTGEKRLFNIKEDIGESNNLALSQPALLQELSDDLTAHLIECDAQRPTLKATGELIAYPNGQ